MKKIGLFMTALISMFAFSIGVSASEVTNETDFVTAINEGGEITLKNDLTINSTVTIGKDVTLNLNDFDITMASGKYLKLTKGHLNITGKGMISEAVSNLSPVVVKLGSSVSDTNYATLTVGKNVKLKGWAGIFVDKFSSVSPTAYGLTINVYGECEGTRDTSNNIGAGIYLNGSIVATTNAPVINIYDGAKLTAEGHGIYAAGYATYNVTGGTIEGDTGIEIRAGILNVSGGTIKGFAIPTSSSSNDNGSSTTGAGIGIAQHTSKCPINVKVTGGTIEGYVPFYQANPENNDATAIAKVVLSITGGTFNTVNNGTQVVYSENKEAFVQAGTFNKEVETKYLEETSISKKSENNYVIAPNKKAENNGVTFESEEAFNNGYVLVVAEMDEEVLNEVNEQLQEEFKNSKDVKDVTLINLYDISLMNGQEIVPMEDGTFKISIDVPENMRNFKTYIVMYLNEDGELAETIEAKLINGKIVFTTTHLSVYGIIGYNDVIKNPETSDNIMTYVALGILSIASISVIILKKQY